ncbi:MAG: DUF6065 family protein [Terricaulis sp.]
MKLTCYPITPLAVEMRPGRPERDWMDALPHKHAYRCLPLVIANTSGWDLLVPGPFRATWNGGPNVSDITIESPFHLPPNGHASHVVSHFGGGVLTFHTHYLFRTEPGWDLWVGGAPNHIKHGIQALTGIVETYWLPQPFTMNWRFTAPGTVSWSAGEPFATIMPVPHTAIDAVEPVIADLEKEDPELYARSFAWQRSRETYIHEQSSFENDWQKHYFKGRYIDDSAGPPDHVHRRRLKAPKPAGE